jgi:pilus assembly protein Flp/PilA
MTSFKVWATNLLAGVRRDEEGQALVEYGLLVALIAVVAVAAVELLGIDVDAAFDNIVAEI